MPVQVAGYPVTAAWAVAGWVAAGPGWAAGIANDAATFANRAGRMAATTGKRRHVTRGEAAHDNGGCQIKVVFKEVKGPRLLARRHDVKLKPFWYATYAL